MAIPMEGSVITAVVQMVVIGGILFCQQLTCISTDDLERMLAAAFLDALQAARLTLKEMAYALGIDEALLRRQLSCDCPQQHLSLQRLVLYAPAAWWAAFGPSLLAVIARREWQELSSHEEVRKRA